MKPWLRHAFKYDPFERRIQKNSSSGTINYLYDGVNIIMEADVSGNTTAKYAQGLGIDQPLAALRGGATSFYHADGLGSITSLTSSTGVDTVNYRYDSFGSTTELGGTMINPFRYTGREWDDETGLYYYRARYYEPAIGRFLSEDPMEFMAGANFYPYVGSNPTNLVDPLGLQHAPGGPWHPEPWIAYGCLATDDCATLSWKIDMFKKIIAGHIAWDAANGPGTHTLNLDIPNHLSGLNYCIMLHQSKCTNKCVKFEPVNPKAVADAGKVVTFAVILYWIISEGSRLFPPRNFIPIL